jgi:farnesyl-diphosphate farnesyltransferase
VTATADTDALRHDLLRTILRQVSRSFYLNLRIVPACVRDQLSLSYLFARAADTIADTDLIERGSRLLYLKQFKAQFVEDRVDWPAVRAIQAALIPHQRQSGERTLLERLDDCFRVYQAFAPDDRARIRRLLTTLTNGMEMDLTVFPGDSAHDLTALKTLDELDRYTYFVAGCVGEFWTEMTCAHVPALASWDKAHMAAIGVRFGKGLQLTNILKDIARDLQRGRCYIPESLLREAGLAPADLLKPDAVRDLRPVLVKLLRIALEHLDQGWIYTMSIPRRELRLRLACMWPILFAGGTLRDVARSADLLNPAVNVKIPKREVRAIIATTILTLGCGFISTALWGHLRKQVV